MWLSYDLAISFLGIFPEMKTYDHTKAYTYMFIAALFVIAQNWKKPSGPMIGAQLNQLRYFRAMEHNPAIKRNKLLINGTAWMNLTNFMLSKRSHIQKNTDFIIPYI